jgi:predicted porin
MATHGKNSNGDTDTFLGLKAGFSRFEVMGVHDVSKAGPSTAKATTLGATYTMNVTTFRLGWGLVDVDGVKAEKLLGVGAVYALSKRTSLYADFAHKIFPTQSANTYGLGIAHGF